MAHNQHNIRTVLRHKWNSVKAMKMIYGARSVKVAQKTIKQQDLKALVMPKNTWVMPDGRIMSVDVAGSVSHRLKSTFSG